MQFDTFKASLASPEPPPNLSLALQALWWDAKGDWDKAHERAQERDDAAGAHVHAYLHRKEGDRQRRLLVPPRRRRPLDAIARRGMGRAGAGVFGLKARPGGILEWKKGVESGTADFAGCGATRLFIRLALNENCQFCFKWCVQEQAMGPTVCSQRPTDTDESLA